ncbi:PIR Superfamily Protein [Plasmodium ovale curtisi]|uniref:PIR Superfamily Protein n=1 Tax=Plasmodium ovale curtisi TaxID=864141 RepID=A0A1A8WIL3_PLAOA|nr:PIR Superfamily Protein [Plasmodium ovale curtisi]
MPLEIQTIYNAANLNYSYKEKLDSYKNSTEMNMAGCQKFTNQHLDDGVNVYRICVAVISFLSYLIEETENTTYRDIGCKYLFYWLYTHVKSNEQASKNMLKLYNELHRIHNEQHNSLGIFNKKIFPVTNDNCISGVSDLYAKYSDECREGYDDFCDELTNFRKKHNFIIQEVLLCQGKQYILPPVEKFDTANKTIIPFSLIPLTSLILPILYKFTAFGPWIRRKIGKNKNIWKNINEETNNSLNTYEIGEDNLNMRDYNIAYNSS